MSEHEFDHRRWYDEVASRTGGYLETWRSTVEGRSGEDAFRELVFGLLEPGMHVLDAGCGSGEFTLAIAQQVERVVGFDFSENMVAAARENARSVPALPVEFVVTETSRLPFEPGSFDLIVSRRGPTGILLRPELLRPGGVMAGIHSLRPDRIRERLAASGLDELGFEHYLANEIFPTRGDFAAFWSRMPGHADYSRPEHEAALEELARKHLTGGRLVVPQERWVWWALLPGVES